MYSQPQASGGGYGSYYGSYGNPFYQQFQPKSAQQIMQEMLAAEQMLPSQLQAPSVDPNAVNQAVAQYKRDVVEPTIAKAKTDNAVEGRDNSTFGAAEIAALKTNGANAAYMAGQDMVDRSMNRWATQRGQFYQNRNLTSPDQGGAEFGNFLNGQMNARSGQMNAFQEYQKQKQARLFMLMRAGIGGLQMGGPMLQKAGQGVMNWWHNLPGGSQAPIQSGSGAYNPFTNNAGGAGGGSGGIPGGLSIPADWF